MDKERKRKHSKDHLHRSLTRSLTRSPTPIKYDYDIYKKRSPTFGRRCPVLNRRPRVSSKIDTDKVKTSKSTTKTSTAKTKRPEQVSSSQAKSTMGNSNRETNKHRDHTNSDTVNNNNNNSNNNSDNVKPVSSRISTTSGGFSQNRSIIWDNPSYFQHDDRESLSKKVSRKRKPRQSPFRWQHDLFEDDGSPLEKVETNASQRKEAKLANASDGD